MRVAVVGTVGGARAFAVFATLATLGLSSGDAIAGSQALVASMTGAHEIPANSSAATGACVANVDSSTLQVSLSGTFTGLSAPASAVTLRGLATAGSTAPALLPPSTLTGATTGTFAASATLTPEQVAGLLAGETYCEVADAAFPAGELRGQVTLPPMAPAMPSWGHALIAGLLLFAGFAFADVRARQPQRRWKGLRR